MVTNYHMWDGTNMTLSCNAPGNFYDFRWVKVGGVLPPESYGATDAVLVIVNATLADTGSYGCLVDLIGGPTVKATIWEEYYGKVENSFFFVSFSM